MEKFIVSARKYRPQTFRTVVGQGHITNTLKNAILNNHLAQAFLFCGPRGVGKTTCARILAKTINCFQITAEGEACDVCESCKSFNEGASLNVYELDAASNNSVDDIRSLIEQVRFAPQLGDYKVYIIDEVHMLSSQAFNAFLKTLEEPPRHAIFILATTEKHKILPTILSRCQIFDFNRIKIEDIAHHLAYIAETEHVNFEPEALHVIAQKADGGLRDACSIFDQMVSFSGNHLTYKAVVENLHVLDYDYYFKLTDALYHQRLPESLLVFDEILKNGFDGHHFIVGLGEHLRNILVCKDPITVQLLEVAQSVREKYNQQAQLCATPFLLKCLGIINRCDIGYKASKNQRLQVEIALMQMAYLNAPSLDGEKKNDSEQQQVESSAKPSPTSVSSPQVSPGYERNKTTDKPVTSFKDLNLKNDFSLRNVVPTAATPSVDQALIPEKKEETEITNIPHEITESDVHAVVLRYAEKKLSEGGRSIAATLKSRKPSLKEGLIICIEVDNEAQKEMFQSVQQEFLEFIRKDVKNNKLQLQIHEIQTVEQSRPVTPLERFAVMKEKNPLLETFMQKFNLEISY